MKGIELEKAYNPNDFEDRIYAEWEKLKVLSLKTVLAQMKQKNIYCCYSAS